MQHCPSLFGSEIVSIDLDYRRTIQNRTKQAVFTFAQRAKFSEIYCCSIPKKYSVLFTAQIPLFAAAGTGGTPLR
jgi:hypothetical protein